MLPHHYARRTYRYIRQHPASTIIAVAAAIAFLPAAADAADSVPCGIFPPPFDIGREDIPARLGAVDPFIPAGYTDIPVLNTGCSLIPKEARVTASLLNGRPVKFKVRAMLADGRGIDRFNAFVTKHVGQLPEDMRTRPESERFNGIYAHWRKDGYEAIYSVQLDPGTSGTYLAQLSMLSLTLEGKKALEEHYTQSEIAPAIEHSQRRAKPTYTGGKQAAHVSDK